jgi:1,4-dihydroxy-2-naphthoate octaprenyltransferase
VLLGISTSLPGQATIDYFIIFLVLLTATFAHISVNMLNEYYDFKSGLDLITKKTPFSGGSGALPGNPEMAKLVHYAGLTSLLLTVIIGLYIMLVRGIEILPFGIVGVVLIIFYTQWLNRFPLLTLIAPGLGFGILMVVGTHVLLSAEQTQLPWLVSLVPFFLINNLLLLNQYPDIKADASVGRNTFPIAFGLKTSNIIYTLFMLVAYLLILYLIIKGYLPILSCIALLPMGFSVFSLSGAIKYSSNIGSYPQYLATNVAAATLTPLLLATSILIG